MSDVSDPCSQRTRDRGMTLPELMIAVVVSAMITGVLCTSIIVTLRQRDNTEGRLNVARAEQNVSLWMPADLASAEAVDTSPEATPCGSPTCGGVYLGNGSNVLMLEWTEVGEGDAICPPEGISNCTVTRVSYNFYPAADGATYELRRVECVSSDLVNWACDSQVILRELPGPPGGTEFVPGVAQGTANCTARLSDLAQADCTRPTWVIIVSEPLDPCAGLTGTELTECVGTDTDGTTKDANRVVVSINGGGDVSGAGGGVNQISITAGGTARRTITADSMSGAPSFLEAHSRCGGPLTLVIDQSGSIPDYARPRVRTAAVEFARLLRGTPVEIQVVEFDTQANVLGDGQSVHPEAGWHEYFEMTEQADWTRLESLLLGMSFGGSTNWEDALFRTFYNPDGTTPQIVPETVVFFTDGVPTVSRQSYRGSPGMPAATPLYDGNLWQTWNGSAWINGESGGHYNQASFLRADNIAARVRAEQSGYVRMIGVGVGGINGDVRWVENPGAGYKTVWERGYGRYQQGSPQFQSNLDFEEATAFQSRVDYEQATGGFQSRVDYEQATGFQANLDYERANAYQARLDYERATVFQANLDYEQRVSGNWVNITDPAVYYTNQPGSPSNYRINGTRSSWYSINESAYDAWRTKSPSNFQATSWTNTTPDLYYPGVAAAPTKWRIYNTNGTRSWYSIDEATYDAWRSQSPSNFQVSGWANSNPTDYYTNQPSAPTKWRTNGTIGWYTVTQAVYDAYRDDAPSNFTATWTDRTPTEYHTGQPSAPSLWRSSGTRSWYTVSQAEYQAYAATSPANYQATWSDRTPTQYFTGQPSAPAMWRINSTARSWYTITPEEYSAYSSTSSSNYQASWTDRTPTEYYTNQPAAPNGWRINGTRSSWYLITEAEYNAYHGADTTVNWRPGTAWTWVSKAAYDAGIVSNPTGFRDTGSNTWMSVATAPDFEIVPSSGTPADQYRSRRIYPSSGPYDGIESRVFFDKKGKEILAQLIAANSTGTVYNVSPDGTDNAEIANMFVIEGNDDAAWAELTPAMKAIALGECGGTLTLATKTSSGAAVSAPFTYENSAVYRADGSAVTPFEPSVVTTNAQYRTRGFDYSVPGGTYITTEIRPQASSVLLRYQPLGWECRAGARTLNASEINQQPIELVVTNPDGSTTTVPSGWSQISVRIGANEAVACTLKVAQTS